MEDKYLEIIFIDWGNLPVILSDFQQLNNFSFIFEPYVALSLLY